MKKKSTRKNGTINQWQFMLAWIGGQLGGLLLIAVGGALLISLMNIFGLNLDTLPTFLTFGIIGASYGFVTSTVQQWSIRKHFGQRVVGWRAMTTAITALAFCIIAPLVLWMGTAMPQFFEGDTSRIGFSVAMYIALFSSAGIGQAILLHKHIKHAWLYAMSTVVGAIFFSMPVFGTANAFTAQIAQFGVIALTLLWLFGMSHPTDAVETEDAALERLSDYDSDADWADSESRNSDQQQKRGRLSQWILRWLKQPTPNHSA